MVSSPNTMRLRPLRIALALGIVIGLLAASCIVTQFVRFEFKMRPVGLIAAFDLNREANVPTLFSVLLLLFAGLLLRLIATAKSSGKDPFARQWSVLSFIFFYMALDEGVGIHELCIRPLRTFLGAGGLFYFSWVIPAILVVVILAVYFYRFVMHFDWPNRLRLIASGVIYLSGALGAEMIGGSYYESVHRKKDLVYSLITTTEETLEMMGLAFFIYVLLIYMEQHLQSYTIEIGDGKQSVD